MVDEGATGIFNSNAGEKALNRAIELFAAVGKVVVLDNERLIDAVTAVSGSGPAYFFLLMAKWMDRREARRVDRFTQFALQVGHERSEVVEIERG